MRTLAALGAISALLLAIAPGALAHPKKPSRVHARGHVRAAKSPMRQVSLRLHREAVKLHSAARPHGASAPRALLSSLEADVVSRMNAQRASRGLRPFHVSRGLTIAAKYHSRQMGRFGFFEHESRNGGAFWRRLERFYPPGRGYWSVGENIFWESPDTSGSSAVSEWMKSAPHRENILTREFRDVGVAAVHFESAPGAFGGRPVTIVTADFGVRR